MVSGAIHAWSFPDARLQKGAGPKMLAQLKGQAGGYFFWGFPKMGGFPQQLWHFSVLKTIILGVF